MIPLKPVVKGVEGDGEGEDVGQRPAEVEHEVELGDSHQQKPGQGLKVIRRIRDEVLD